MIRSIARRMVLAIPPLKRLHDFARDEGRRADDVESRLADRSREYEILQRMCEKLQQECARMEREIAASLEERDIMSERMLEHQAETRVQHDKLEMELYLLRSDLHRAAERNERLSAALAASSLHRQK